MGVLLIILAQPVFNFAQESANPTKRIPEKKIRINSKKTPDVPLPVLAEIERDSSLSHRMDSTPNDIKPDDQIWMEFNLEWTNYQIHRVNDYEPIEIILSGNISGSNTLNWNLSTAHPQSGGQADLYFMEDVLGRTGLNYGSNIPLTWEIALDGSPFFPMKILPDNSISAVFPPGAHTFQVRITGVPFNNQSGGYYHLQLEQYLVPAL
jgi:hypothetical protein